MLVPADPRKGGGKAAGWSFSKVPARTRFNAFKAGECFGVFGHYLGGHKPCALLYTGGAVECPGCAKGREVQWFGYLPLYRTDGKPVVVGIKEYTLDVVAGIELHQAVKVGREDGPSEGVWVLHDKGTRPYKPTCEARRKPADLGEWLLRLWRWPEFANYCRSHRTAALVASVEEAKPQLPVSADTPKPEVVEDRDVRYLRELQERAENDRLANVNQPVTDYIRGLPIYPKLAPASAAKNGKHAKPKPQ